VLEKLEKEKTSSASLGDLPLFAAVQPAPEPAGPSELDLAMKAINPDDLTPREALEVLYRLKGLAQ